MRIEKLEEIGGPNDNSHDTAVISEEETASGSEYCEANIEEEAHFVRDALRSRVYQSQKVGERDDG